MTTRCLCGGTPTRIVFRYADGNFVAMGEKDFMEEATRIQWSRMMARKWMKRFMRETWP